MGPSDTSQMQSASPDFVPGRPRVEIVSTYFAPETTGNAPYVTSLARTLATRGYQVSVIAGAPHYPGWRTLPPDQWRARESSNGLTVQRVESYVPQRPNFLNRVLYEVGFGLKFAARHDASADLVLLVSPSLFDSCVVRLRLAMSHKGASRVVVWVQDLYSVGVGEAGGRAPGLAAAAIRAIEGRLLRSSDRVVAIHDRFRDAMVDHLAVDPGRIWVVRNWTHVTPPSDVDVAAIRELHGWRPGELIVLHAGNMGAKQGLENVVDAGRLAEARGLPLRFVLLGDGNQRKALEDLAGDCPKVSFMDPLPDDLFVPTLASADGLLVNERPGAVTAAVPSKLTSYFSTGRPVVAATEHNSTTADELRASRAGTIVGTADPEALVGACLDVHDRWTDEDSTKGPEFVRRVLSQESAVEAFAHLLDELASQTTPSMKGERP